MRKGARGRKKQKNPKATPQQKAFVIEYVKSRNGAEAARLAGYSAKNAATQAYELLKRKYIQDLLSEESKIYEHDIEITRKRTLKKIEEIAFSEGSNSADVRKMLELLVNITGLKSPEKIELTGRSGGPVETVDYSSLTEEEAKEEFERKLAEMKRK